MLGAQSVDDRWPGRSPTLGGATGSSDPLVVRYVLAMDNEPPEDMSPYQGFSHGWASLQWALDSLVEMPAHVLEPNWALAPLLAQRMGGTNHLQWVPLNTDALDAMAIDDLGYTVVVFSGTRSSADAVAAWASRQPRPILHVSSDTREDVLAWEDFDLLALRDYCAEVFARHHNEISPDRAGSAIEGFPNWAPRAPIPTDLKQIGHNITMPNHMVLRRAGRALGEATPYWMSTHEIDYTRVIIESAEAVMAVRRASPLRELNRLYIPQPQIVLTEPALFRFAYARGSSKQVPELTQATLMMVRRMQLQKGLASPITGEEMAKLVEDQQWQAAIGERAFELRVHAQGVGLMAAQSCAAVLRLRPEVNHVFSRLSEFGRNIRATSPHARAKSARLFARVQTALARAVGPERLAFIEKHGGPIKIVADAPLELLPIAGLPLALRYDTSRTNATPGNLMMGELVSRRPATLTPKDLMHVLVVSAFAPDDPLREEMRSAFDRLERLRPGEVTIEFRRVATVDEFIAAVNASDAPILVFDGHGAVDESGISGLYVGTEFVDVWSLRPYMHSPPIVILSACDTHGLDAPTHATTGNSFLAVGAATVLATLLPVGGAEAALFIYRVLLHLVDFVPAAISARRRAMSWSEMLSGVLRLTLASDIMDALIRRKLMNAEVRSALFQTALNDVLNSDSNWFEGLSAGIMEQAIAPAKEVEAAIQSAIAHSEAIRYIQLGRPESIVIGTEDLIGEFRKPAVLVRRSRVSKAEGP